MLGIWYLSYHAEIPGQVQYLAVEPIVFSNDNLRFCY